MERDVTLRDGRILHIRRPRGEDASRLLEHLKIIGGETDFLLLDGAGLPYTVEQEAAVLERFYIEPRGGMFIGEVDGEIACTFNLSCNSKPRIAHAAEIALAAKKKFWGIGVGAVIMETLIDLAREAGVKTVELGVYAENLRAQALYRRRRAPSTAAIGEAWRRRWLAGRITNPEVDVLTRIRPLGRDSLRTILHPDLRDGEGEQMELFDDL